jgi:general secretion pathway protein B
MSYILDALRRADAERERERGEVPGLYTTQVPGGAADWAPTPRRLPWLAITIGIGAVVLLIGGMAAWMAFSREPVPAPIAAVAISPAPSSLLPPDVPAAVANPAPPALPASTAAAALPSTPDAAAKPAAVAKVSPTAAAASAAVKAARPVTPPRTAASAPPVSTAKAAPTEPPSRSASPAPALAPAAASAAKPPRVPTLAELPADIRQQLPTLAVGGAMYSPTPSNRMLILNGQLYHEGEQPAPGLTLESIQLRSAVLSFKGQRYEISY